MALNNRAVVLQRLGNLDEAEFDFRSVLLAASDDVRLGGMAQHNLGALLGLKGAVREAFDRLGRAAVDRDGQGLDGGQALIAEAEILLTSALFEECLAAGGAALEIERSRPGGSSLEVPDLLMLNARALARLGALTNAGQAIEQAEHLYSHQGRHASEERCGELRGVLQAHQVPDIGPDEPGADAVYEALIALGDHDPDFAPTCWAAATRALESERKQLRVLGRYAQARLLLDGGRVAAAKSQALLLIETLAEHTADINAVELRAALVFGLVDVEGLAVRIAAAGDPADLACLVDAANTVVHSTAPLSATDTELVTQLDATNVDRKSDPARIDRAEVELLEGRLRSLHRRMERTAAPPRQAIGIEQLRAAACEQTLVMFAELGGHVWRLVLPSSADLADGVTLVDLGDLDTLTTTIRRVRHVSDSLARRPSPIPHQLIEGLDRRAGELDAVLFAGVDIAPDSEVMLFPGRFLTSVPWRVLPSVKRWRLGINVGTPLVCRNEQDDVASAVPRRRALVVAGPDLGDGIAAEVERVAALYDDPIVLTGSEATVSAVLRAFEEVDIAHVAGHGSLHAKDPLLAMITLFDGPLTVYDIEMANATPPMVVLASCLVGSGGSTGSDVSYGFASALASRGTKELIISPVELDDDKTAFVMPELHRALAAGVPARKALDDLRFDQLDLERVADSLLAVEAESFS
ncbi:MAG: CHAT domain-containing protein [Acidimicrobiales bacterium]